MQLHDPINSGLTRWRRMAVLNEKMDAAAELGRNPVNKHQIQREYGDEETDVGRDCRTRLATYLVLMYSISRTGTSTASAVV